MIQFILKKGASKYYNYTVKYLMKCKNLDANIAHWRNVKRHDDYFRDLAVEHKAKRGLWSRYQLAL